MFCLTGGWNSRIQNILCDDSIISRHLHDFGFFRVVRTSQERQNICRPVTFLQCWTNIEDVVPTLYKCHTNVLCLLGCRCVKQMTFSYKNGKFLWCILLRACFIMTTNDVRVSVLAFITNPRQQHTLRLSSAGSMLGQRQRRSPNIKPTLD